MEKELKSKQMDMINGPIWNKLLMFAFPVAATAVLEQLFNASDIAIVGNFTGEGKTIAVAAVGANSSIIALIVNAFVGVALGANVVIANAIGRRDKETVSKAVHTSIVVAILAGIFISVIGELVAGPLLSSLNVPDDVFPEALLYLRIYLLGMPVILLYNFEAAVFRSTGDTKTPLMVLAVSGVLNVAMNLFFVAILNMSVEGVAIATVTSNAISSVWLFRRLLKSDGITSIELKRLRIDRKILIRIMKIGLPAGIQSSVFGVANIVIQSAINSLGTVIMAASSAAYNIEIFAYFVMNSFSQACTTFVGQNYGAGQIKRCRRVLKLCIVETMIATGTAIFLVLFFGKSLLAIFNNDPEVIEYGYIRIMMIFSSYIFSMLYDNMSGYMRGFGISLMPAVLAMVGVCGIRLFWIAFVFPSHRSLQGILMVYPVSLSVTALLIFILLMVCRPSKKFQLKE